MKVKELVAALADADPARGTTMKSSTYSVSSGMPATPEKALCGNVSAKRR
jgi:hypothetical protein